MGLVINELKEDWLIPEDQKEEDKPVKYLVAALSGADHSKLMMASRFVDGEFEADPDSVNELVEQSVQAWINVTDMKGKEIAPTAKSRKMIPYHHRIEIFQKINELTRLSQDESKNS